MFKDAQAAAAESKLQEAAALLPVMPRLQCLMPGLAKRLRSPTLSDVTLRCADGVEFPCHRVILCCGSQYFAELFEGGGQFSQVKILDLKGADGDSVDSMLRILYFEATPHDVLVQEPRRANRLLVLASQWRMQDVYEDCLEFVRSELADIEALEFLASSTGFGPESMRLQEVVHDRLIRIRELESSKVTLNRGVRESSKVVTKSSAAERVLSPSRWPTSGKQAASSDMWSTGISCPRGMIP